MAFIDIDPNLNITETIATLMLSFITDSIEFNRSMSVTEILAEKTRSGLDATILSNSIISRFNAIGIPTGPLANGTSNVMESFVKIICEEVINAIHNDMRVDLGIFPGGTINANGANAGGPVVSVGSVMVPQSGVGIAM